MTVDKMKKEDLELLSNKDITSSGFADVVISQSLGIIFSSESLTHPPTI